MNDCQYPWTILVPRRKNISEIIDMNQADQQQLWRESAWMSCALQQHCKPDKLNVAALGNKVPQLHIHHIARFKDDPAWPQPVWGKLPATAYSPTRGETEIAALRKLLEQQQCEREHDHQYNP